MKTNLRPADELFAIRAQIKDLQEREKALKEGIASGELESVGEFTIVTISTRKTNRFDRKAAEAELGDLSRFEKASEYTVVRVEEIHHETAT